MCWRRPGASSLGWRGIVLFGLFGLSGLSSPSGLFGLFGLFIRQDLLDYIDLFPSSQFPASGP